MKNRTFLYTVKQEDEGLRVKDILSRKGGYSRREVTSFNANHGITLNGRECRLSQTIQQGDTIKAVMTQLEANRHGILPDHPEVLYEDDDMIIVNKPAGLPVHATKEHEKDHMGTLLRKHCGEDFVIRPIGRLDKDVSGVMCYAKSKEAAALLSAEHSSGEFQKTYYAVIHGFLEEKEGTLQYRLGKTPGEKAQRFTNDGQLCITEYRVLEEEKDTSFLEVKIHTGRNHQIRAGFAGYGHPLVGDRLYGGTGRISRPALHCGKLTLRQPRTGKLIHAQAPLPADIKQLIEK